MCIPECQNGGNCIVMTDTVDDTIDDTVAADYDYSGSAYYYYDNSEVESETNQTSIICDCRNEWEGTTCETRKKSVYRYCVNNEGNVT